MNKFIGLDVHFQSTTVVVLDDLGNEELRQVIPTKEQMIRSLINSIPGHKSLTFFCGGAFPENFKIPALSAPNKTTTPIVEGILKNLARTARRRSRNRPTEGLFQ